MQHSQLHYINSVVSGLPEKISICIFYNMSITTNRVASRCTGDVCNCLHMLLMLVDFLKLFATNQPSKQLLKYPTTTVAMRFYGLAAVLLAVGKAEKAVSRQLASSHVVIGCSGTFEVNDSQVVCFFSAPFCWAIIGRENGC